jgi:predicted MFS family arabinose efflux permease
MTTRTLARGDDAAVRPRLVTRPLLIRFVSVAGAAASFFLMLSVVPLYARSAGASTGTAGLTTTALSLSTVAGYLPSPRLVARFGHRAVLVAGLVLLGAPALVLTFSANLTVIMVVCAVRGIGFAATCVAGGALTAMLLPAERRGEGLALVGVVSGVPSATALSLGVWLAAHLGYGPVFVAAAIAALAPLASMPGLPGPAPRRLPPHQAPHEGPHRAAGVLSALRAPSLIRPAIVFSTTAMGAGVFVTFVPLAAPRPAGGAAAVVAPALFIQLAASIGGRWLAGRLGDRRGAATLLGPAALLGHGSAVAAAGLALLTLTSVPAAVIASAVLFGTGFGIAQNASLTLMYSGVPESGYSTVSAVWNLAYDAGMGVGAAAFGALAAQTGYPVAFAAMAAILPATLLAARGKTPGRKPRRKAL